ncbi:MAG: hypothetical protein K2Q10_02785, partial [Rhodospirillales bacterium]|nr:hypothetical protein [Rhodospirillales bacterium]
VKEGVVSAVKDIGATLKEKWQQGLVEMSNMLYQESGIPVPPVISQSQLEAGESDLGAMEAQMRQRSAQQDKEIER